MMRTIIFSLCLLASPTLAYYGFRNKIPNGDSIPHPCFSSEIWKGVGHENKEGGGPRNPFGLDFKGQEFQWTPFLCGQDSDGDGKTNGEELGDPDCEWTEGSSPLRTTNITHPGVCDPVGEGVCAGKDTFVNCSQKSFLESCEATQGADVMTLDFQFNEHVIPNTETNYYCQYFDLPTDQDYHIVANKALIDNYDLLHHLIVYGCPDDYAGSPNDYLPNPCSMTASVGSCNVPVSMWTLGLEGSCFASDKGFRIGMNGYKKVKMEIHYNNPMLMSGMSDTSGLRLYYQPAKPGTQDLATLTVGQILMEIPPGQERYEVNGTCPSGCSQFLITKPINVMFGINHMHRLGISQRTVVHRNGQLLKEMAFDEHYSYDAPKIYKERTPFQVLPGDQISTSCVFDSTRTNRYVYYGEGTSDEMCFGFLIFYPADAMPMTTYCSDVGPLSACDMAMGAPKLGCNWKQFTDLSDPESQQIYHNLIMNCNLNGRCRPECRDYLQELKDHPCLKEDFNLLLNFVMDKYHDGTRFLARLYSCSGEDDVTPAPSTCPTCPADECASGNGAERWTSPGCVIVFVMALVAMVQCSHGDTKVE